MDLQSPSSSGSAMQLMFKNRLQEYVQKLDLPFPVYQTINEGFPHAPLFRATVIVGGETYQSHRTFKHRKASEQDVARLAFHCISKKIKVECAVMISENTLFCKSILNEFMLKMNMEKPSYTTVQTEGLLPAFISSVVFDGMTCAGNPAKSKKEAEQLAARKVIQTILELSRNSSHKSLLLQIIKSKSRRYAAPDKNATSNGTSERVSAASSSLSSQICGLPVSCPKDLPAKQITDPLPYQVVNLKKKKVDYVTEVASGSTGNEMDSVNKALRVVFARSANKGSKVPLQVVHTCGHGISPTVGNLERKSFGSPGYGTEASNQTVGAAAWKVKQELKVPSGTIGCKIPLAHGPLDATLITGSLTRRLRKESG